MLSQNLRAPNITNNWNLDHADTVISASCSIEWQTTIEARLSEVQRILESNQPLTAFENITRLDSDVFEVWAALSLFQFSGPNTLETTQLKHHLEAASNALTKLIDLFRARASEAQTPPNLVKEWLKSLSPSKLPGSLQLAYFQITDDLDRGKINQWQALASRALIDPQKKVFRQRLLDNKIKIEGIGPTANTYAESQKYFSELLEKKGKVATSVSEIRDLEEQSFNNLKFQEEEAIALIHSAFSKVHNTASTELALIVEEGRLRFLDSPSKPDLCIDTPFGSYVQLYFDGSLFCLIRLAHELGHAVHQFWHRQSAESILELTEVECETWAMAFENKVLDYLESTYPNSTLAISSFRKYQKIEMNHRHRMLHQFECSLHEKTLSSEDDINELWLDINRNFYGDQVLFDSDFSTAWQEVYHIFTSPFYLSVYAFSKERADNLSPDFLITPLKGRIEK